MLLKEGTDTSQGKGQLLSNISACLAVAETLSSTLGPRGMDKLIINQRGDAQITNDGATILKLLDIVHPAARTLVDIARAQDAEVGDGTTSVTLLAAQLLKEVRGYIEEDVSPHIIMKGFRQASQLVRTILALLALSYHIYPFFRPSTGSKPSRLPWTNQIQSMDPYYFYELRFLTSRYDASTESSALFCSSVPRRRCHRNSSIPKNPSLPRWS